MKLFWAKRFGLNLLLIILVLTGNSTVFSAGEIDPTFNGSIHSTLSGPVHDFKRQPDGKILFGGFFLDVTGVAAGGLGRLNADLTVDSSFNPPDFGGGFGVGGVVYALGIQSDGKIIVGGDIYGVDNVFNPGLKRLFPNGTLDSSFQPPSVPPGTIYYDIEVLPDDKILVGGFRLNPNGSIDNSFTPINSGVKLMEVQPDGKILVGTTNFLLRRYNSDGTVDGTFAVATMNATINTILYLPGGKIMVGGDFSTVNSFQQGRIARINSDGTPRFDLQPEYDRV